jgi:transcriptional regulator with XRE-family HTH domain
MGGRVEDGYTLNKAQSDQVVARVRALMKGPPKITQKDLEAGTAGELKQGYISRLLGGKVRLTERTLTLLAKALKVKPTDLLPRSVAITSASTGNHATTEGRSEPAGRLPPNVEDFIRRMAEAKRYDDEVLESLRSGARRPGFQFATEQELIDHAEWLKRIVERAKAWAPPR